MKTLKHIGILLSKRNNGWFFILLLGIYLSMNFQHILFLPPQGIHFIRQTDSLSFVRHYLHHGMHFFEPGILNLSNTDGKAASEFPILYYLTAILYLLTGEHEFILRLINIAIVSFGLFSLFRMLKLILTDPFYSLIFTFLFFSSTVLIYYTNNFLPDAAALGFALAGWYFSYRFLLERNKTGSLTAGLLFFTLSSLIKITFYINPLAFILTLIITDLVSGKGLLNTFKINLKPLLLFILSFLIVLAWNSYVIRFNQMNQDHYFLVKARPVWTLNANGISTVFNYMANYWYSQYYYQSTLHVFGLLFLAGLVFVRHSEMKLQLLALILLLGSLAYFLLFFEQFQNHDYYFIALVPGIIFITISSFVSIKKRFPLFTGNIVVRTALLILCILSLNYARQKLSDRYVPRDDMYANIGNELRDMKSYLDQLGIARTEKVILITDLTPNGGLYFLDHPGWNLKDTSVRSLNSMDNFIRQGAGYVILTDSSYQGNENLKRFLGLKVGEKNNIRVYKTSRSFYR